jgi:hypothetical protein
VPNSDTDQPDSIDQDQRTPFLFNQLYVEPNDTEDFEKEACQRLLDTIARAGASNVDDVNNITVSLEDFFNGNHCKHSIAANVEPAPPYDTANSWFQLLKKVRATEGVYDVLVAISMIEPYDDGRVGTWPYSDTIWIYSSLDRDTVASLVAPLEPDEVRDASLNDPCWDLTPPVRPCDGVRPYWVWWD